MTESLMQPSQVDHTGDSRLRFVFDGAVVSCGLATRATFEDIARTLDEVAPLHCGNPVSIDLTLGSRLGKSVRRVLDWPDSDP
jgi:hypothetical protein